MGKDAKEMLGRTPGNIVAIRPMKDGVIADFEVTEKMLSHFIRKAHNRNTLVRPRIIIGIPSRSPRSRSARSRTRRSRPRPREVYLIEEPMAAAIGAGLPITEPTGNMIVDIGGGTTEVAVISLAGIVYASRCGWRERDGRGDRPVHQEEVQPAHRRAHGRGDQDRARLGLPAGRAADHGDQGPRPDRTASPRRSSSPTTRSARRWPSRSASS